MKARRPVSDERDLTSLLRRMRLDLSDPGLLTTGLTHRSYAFEKGGLPHNERLEFLGDAVLGLVVTDMIFEEFPALSEGEMAKLRASTVNMAVLADVARSLDLGTHLYLGRGEELSGGRDKTSILADALEAVIGALYLDQGLEIAAGVVRDWFGPVIRDHVEQGVVRDFKTKLQEEAVKSEGRLPEYRITSSGPDHAKQFRASVFLGGRMLGEGEGGSKKEAEQAAAKEALEQLEGQEA
ncbi:MAG: ribonuclease III [Actinomycetota bacterium]